MSKQLDYVEFPSNALHHRRTSQFIGEFGRNCPIVDSSLINGSDDTHRMRIIRIKSWPLDPRWTAEMMPHRVRYKNASNACRWITIGRFKCVSVGFNLTRYNSFDQRLILNHLEYDSSTNQDAPRTPRLKWPSTVTILRTIRRSACSHVTSDFDH